MSRALKQVLQYKESVARIHQELTITQILQIQACVPHSTMSSYEISIPCGNLDTDTNTSTRQYRRWISTRMNVSVSTAHNINRRLKFLSTIFTNTSHSENLETEAICGSATEVLYLGIDPMWPLKKPSLKMDHLLHMVSTKVLTVECIMRNNKKANPYAFSGHSSCFCWKQC